MIAGLPSVKQPLDWCSRKTFFFSQLLMDNQSIPNVIATIFAIILAANILHILIIIINVLLHLHNPIFFLKQWELWRIIIVNIINNSDWQNYIWKISKNIFLILIWIIHTEKIIVNRLKTNWTHDQINKICKTFCCIFNWILNIITFCSL